MNSKLNKSILIIILIMIISTLQISARPEKIDAKQNINNSKFMEYSEISKISPEIQEIIKESPNETIRVSIYLKDQPLHNISQISHEKYKSKLEDIQTKVQAYYKKARTIALARKNVAAASNYSKIKIQDETSVDIASVLNDVEKKSIFQENSKFERIKQEMVNEILYNTKEKIQPMQQKVENKIQGLGGSINGKGSFYNVVFARISSNKIIDLKEISDIEYIEKTGIYSNLLDTSTYSIYSNTFWNNGYFGFPWAAAVVDTGVDKIHPALSVSYEGVFHSSGQTYPDYNDSTFSKDDLQGHGTHVAGIIKSNDSAYRGVANGTVLMNAKFGWRTTNGDGKGDEEDAMRAIDWAINSSKGDSAEVISFSFGGSASSSETSMSRYFDSFVDSLGVVGVIAAGNAGPGSGTIGDPAVSYNAITVGAMDDMDTISRADDSIASYSSRGPVPGTSRIKPDIMAPGSSIRSTAYNWEGDNPDFITMSGTSMAAPHISGAAALLMSAGVYDPKEIKALLINTAEDKGAAGGDYNYGWGYVDLNHTFFHTPDVRLGIVNTTNRYKLYKGYAFSEDKASLVWNRHVVYAGASYPINYYSLSDLDLYMYNESDGTLISYSYSGYQNVEQVLSNASTNTVIKVHAYGFSSGISSEEFALASEEGFSATSLPNLSLDISNTNIVGQNKNFNISINITNWGDVSSHNVNVTLSLPSGFTIISGSNYYNIGSIAAGSRKNANWTVNSHSIGGRYSLSASYNSLSYGETYTASNSSSILVEATPPVIIGNPTSYESSFSAARNGSRIRVNATISYNISPIKNATVDAFSINGSLINPIVLMNVSGYWINESIVVNASDGIYLLNVTAYDNAGNKNDTVQISVIVDNTPPLVNELSISSGYINMTDSVNITANITSSDNVSQVNQSELFARVTYPNGTSIDYPLSGGSGSLFYKNFTDTAQYGRYNVTILANDTTGNTNSTQRTQFVTTYMTNLVVVTDANTETLTVAPYSNTMLRLFINNSSNGTINISRSKVNLTSNALGVTNPGIYMLVNASARIINNLSYVIISVNYTDTEVSSYVESSLRLYRWNTTSSGWDKISGAGSYPYVNDAGVDTENNLVWANLTTLGEFAVTGDVYVPPTQQSSSSSGGGGGGGGSGTSGENYSNIELKEKRDIHIFKDRVSSYKFNTTDPIMYVNITGNINAGEVTTMVEVLRNTTSIVKSNSSPGIVYKNLNIWVGTSGFATPKNIQKGVISFRVQNSWLRNKGVTGNDVMMVKWDGIKWLQIETTKRTEGSEYTYYEAYTDSFSPFAITAVRSVAPQVEAIKTAIITETPAPEETKMIQKETPELNGGLLVFGVILFIIVTILAVVHLRKKKKI